MSPAISTFFLKLFVSALICSSTATMKCTLEDKRSIFDSCAFDYRTMVLWCDYTNFTFIPNPEDIKSQAPCDMASHLFFNDSCLTNINPVTLQKYISLKVVNFSNNQLTEIDDTTFSIALLEVLDLSKNKISVITAKAFSNLINLEDLYLSRNKLSFLPTHVFKKLTKLQILEIDNNILETLSEQWFSKRSVLKKLNVENNRIKTWLHPHKKQFMELEIINAGGNQLKVLTKRNFEHLNNLRNIDFGDNDLIEIEDGAFDHSSDLETVDLRNNKLKYLPKDLLSKHCELRTVLLSGNSFTFIYTELFGTLLHHKKMVPAVRLNIDLKNNPWRCDYGLAKHWMLLQILEQNQTTFRHDLDIECHSPKELQGSTLMGISRHQLLESSDAAELAFEDFISIKCKQHNFSRLRFDQEQAKFEYQTLDENTSLNPASAVVDIPRITLIVSLVSMVIALIF